MLLAVIQWHCQLLPRTVPGAHSHAGAEPPAPSSGTELSLGEGRAGPVPPQVPMIQGWHIETLCLLASSGPPDALGQ